MIRFVLLLLLFIDRNISRDTAQKAISIQQIRRTQQTHNSKMHKQLITPYFLLLLGINLQLPSISIFGTSPIPIFSTLTTTNACRIAGTDSGTCYNVFETNAGIQTNVFDEGCNPTVDGKATGQCSMFCGEILSEMGSICVPRLDPTFANHTYQNKDAWIEDMFKRITNERKALEMNYTMMDLGVDEYGQEGEVIQRFWNGDEIDPDGIKYRARNGGSEVTECEKSFKHYMCYINFPRCDAEKNSLIMCRSICENLMSACNIPQWLHRCGDAKYMYDSFPETPTQNPETLDFDQYYRAPFPGAPFRDYEEEWVDGEYRAVPKCTPSVIGSSRSGHGDVMVVSVVVLVSLVVVMFL